jgi:hypothetical protein
MFHLDPVPSFLGYAYTVGRSYPAGIVLGHTLNLYKRFILCSNTERTAIVVHFENNHVLLASRGYEYDGFLDFLNSIVFISLNDNV